MFRQLVACCFFFTLFTGAAADEVLVNWQRLGSEFYARNKLPAGATVKIRVTYVPDNTMGQKFIVNGQKFTAKAKGDVFEAKVSNQGNSGLCMGTVRQRMRRTPNTDWYGQPAPVLTISFR